MAYTRVNWEDLPSTETPINAENLNKMDKGIYDLFQMMYPVGSIYISVTNTNPSDLFGGTWEQIKDLFLLSAGDTYSVGETGGSATHTLTVNEMPNHNHTLKGSAVGSSDKGETVAYGGATSGTDMVSLSSTGGGQSFSIMPPYLAVYMWKRIG